MKNLLILFALTTLLFSCTCNKEKTSESKSDEAEMIVVDEPQDLSEYEYVCAHCQLGSHEAGQCPCGMDYEKNPEYAGVSHEGHNHDATNLSEYEYICSHCQKGSHSAGECACGMEMEKNPDFESKS